MTDGRAGVSGVRTVFLGSGGFGRESLLRLNDHDDVRLVGVVTAPARPAGRHQHVTSSVIDTMAGDLGVEAILRPQRLRSAESIAAVLALDPEIVVLADYGQIIPAPLLDLRYGALNLHPSLLPRHRGSTPIPATILAGDVETGVTLMRMNAGLDTGPLIAQERIALDGTETTPQLEELLATVAADLLHRSLGRWLRGELVARPQPADGVTLTRVLRREDGRLDLDRSAVELERQIRAYQPWPGTFLETPGGRLIVWAAQVTAGSPGDRPGMIVDDGDGIAIATTDGRLHLVDVQPAGGRRMTGAAFRRGLRVPWLELLRPGLP